VQTADIPCAGPHRIFQIPPRREAAFRPEKRRHFDCIQWPNVLFVRSRLKRIERLLQSREVVQAND
jgi:hypothetical protein